MQFKVEEDEEERTLPSEGEIRGMAVVQYADNELEIDDDAIVSIGEDQDGVTGAWVAAWVWVDLPEDD